VRRPLLAVLAIAVVVAGCGASTDVRDEGDVRQVDQVAKGAVGTLPAPVYLLRYGQLEAVTRRVQAGGSLPREALDALLAGPTTAEQGRRFVSAIPAGVEVGSFTVGQSGVASVTLVGSSLEGMIANQTLDTGASARQRQRLMQQLVYTLTAFPTIQFVDISLNTSPVALTSTMRGRPLNRENFSEVPPPQVRTVCGQRNRPVPPGRPVRLRLPVALQVIKGIDLSFEGVTTLGSGAIVVRLVQDGHVLASIEAGPSVQYNEPSAGGGVQPCPRFRGTLEVPWGVRGPATLRIEIQPAAGQKKVAPVERIVTLETEAGDGPA
jgi:hypothetical protein